MKKDYSHIKNIIFDLDNTIILDLDEDSKYYKKALRSLGYDENDYYKIYCLINEYEKSLKEENCYYNKQDMLNFINKEMNKNYDIKLIDKLLECLGNYWIERVLLKEKTLEYLSQKYNLYIYTNFFEEAQAERIKNIGYSKYFKKVLGADNYGCKPFKKCFEKVLEEIRALPEECLMIGDNKSKDIMAANNVNMKSILYDYDGKRDKKYVQADNYIIIKNLEELEKIL